MAEFYYNLETHAVEEGRVADAMDRMGPYPTREAAENALTSAKNRNDEWDQADRAWNDNEDDGR